MALAIVVRYERCPRHFVVCRPTADRAWCACTTAVASIKGRFVVAQGGSHTPSCNPCIGSIRAFISRAPFEEPTVQPADDSLSAAMILPTPKLFESRNGIRSLRCSGICDYTAPDPCRCSPRRFDHCFNKQGIAPWSSRKPMIDISGSTPPR